VAGNLATIPIHRPCVGEPELAGLARVLESRWLGMGRLAREFEERVSTIAEARHAVAVASGSAALQLSLAALELGPGDEIILPAMTFVSCPQAIAAVGATPVFCDVEEASVGIDVADAASRVTERTRAVMPVHYAGFPCDLGGLVELARDHGLAIVEDAAHAFGSSYGERPIGAIGNLTCFSFDPVKNITCGEGGAVTTNDDELARKLLLLRNLGVGRDSWARRDETRPWYYESSAIGIRSHLPDVNAAIGLAQLDRMESVRARKRELLRRYLDGLAGVDGVIPVCGDIDTAFPFLCAVRVLGGRRDALLDHLERDGIQAWVHFVPCHLQPAFAGATSSLPVTERLFDELITLPLYAELSDEDVDRVVSSVRTCLGAA
jgi:perosamine synthetase